ncbi:MAG: hypothetical protein KGJ66_09650 [Alphaproteobacteria bacterium]|nr:hypothetical protein [Alphaproteobacteria bacterium]
MWHWILEHRNAFNDIGLVWLVPVLVVLVATRLFRPGYHRGSVEPIPLRTDEQRTETQKPRSAA